jgi:tRNA nucleotidyltransferase (CCA-adding enzyme)
MDMNSSKLNSPIVLVDPTYKQRNALAALSQETFDKFKESCKKFIKNPSIKSFEIKKTDLKKIKEDALKNKYQFVLLKTLTNKQEGDVAGTKLFKFYRHLNYEISKYFDIKKKGFNYNKDKSAKYFFVAKNKKEILHKGPNIKDVKNCKKFKKEHKKCFIKNKKLYSLEKINFSLNNFISKWKIKNKKKIKEMYIKELKIIS